MSRRNTITILLISFICMVAGTFIGSWYAMARDNSTQTSAFEDVALPEQVEKQRVFEVSGAAVAPTPEPEPEVIVKEQISPDGEMTVVVEQEENRFEVMVISEEMPDESQSIFSGELANGEVIEVPFNAWSPDKKFFFLKRAGAEGDAFWVFKASGETFGTGEDAAAYVDVSGQYVEEEIPHELTDITGWATTSFLLVQTDGPSYWYSLPGQRFMRLSTQF